MESKDKPIIENNHKELTRKEKLKNIFNKETFLWVFYPLSLTLVLGIILGIISLSLITYPNREMIYVLYIFLIIIDYFLIINYIINYRYRSSLEKEVINTKYYQEFLENENDKFIYNISSNFNWLNTIYIGLGLILTLFYYLEINIFTLILIYLGFILFLLIWKENSDYDDLIVIEKGLDIYTKEKLLKIKFEKIMKKIEGI